MGRIWLECVGLVLLIGILLAGGLYIHLFVHVVPPISGKVVDAITGQPVPGMKVCLQVDSDVLDQVPRKEVSEQRLGQVLFLALGLRQGVAVDTGGVFDPGD